MAVFKKNESMLKNILFREAEKVKEDNERFISRFSVESMPDFSF